MSRKSKDVYKRLAKLNKYYDSLMDYFGYQMDYTPYQIKSLWKSSELTVDEVAERLYRSRDRALQYCYGQNMSKRLRREIAKFFKMVIYFRIGNTR